MTGSGLSEMRTVGDPELAVAHLVFKVADLKISCQFYSNLGLPPFAIIEDEKVAIIELRGGTHLLLLEGDQLADMPESVTGQFHERLAEQFDLMIKGQGLNALKQYRLELISRGIAAGEIPDEMLFGHHLFCIKDPDRHGITIYTSHAMQ
jgi:predicted lactoylglutathione lyase